MIQLYILAGSVIAAGLIGGTTAWKVQSWRFAAKEAKAVAAVAEWEQKNRDLQRSAEKRYTVVQGIRDRFIVQTIREIRHAAAPLASCPVPEPARGLLNDAADCARGDSPSACGADDGVRKP